MHHHPDGFESDGRGFASRSLPQMTGADIDFHDQFEARDENASGGGVGVNTRAQARAEGGEKGF